jgi:hypothetical protein
VFGEIGGSKSGEVGLSNEIHKSGIWKVIGEFLEKLTHYSIFTPHKQFN